MKKIFLLLIGFLITNNAIAATTYYVRVNGSTSTNCTGTTNADYSGSGTDQACAFNHPAWALGAVGTSAIMVGGDTLMIDDNSGTAQYLIGYGMPNTSGCSAFAPVDCVLKVPPSGTVSAPTKIFGSAYATGCATKPQLYGTQSVKQVIKLSSVSNIDMECIEITDHSSCGFRVGATTCSETYNGSSVGTYGREGIAGAGVANLTLKNIDIHGMSDRNIELGDLTGVAIISHVNIDGGYQAGWDGDTRAVYGGSGALNTGTMIIDHTKTRFNGCQEAYPRSSSFSASDYTNCVDQNANPPGYGDGWATYDAGGTYNITNSEWSHNAQDGLDFLYCPNNCTFNIDKSKFEGNNGNQLKISAKTLNLTNSLEIANCNYLRQSSKVYNTATWSDCRANGSPLAVTPVAGSTYTIQNNTAYSATGSGGSPFIEISNRYGTCNGTETYTFKNNVLYSPDAIWQAFYNGLTGSCSTQWTSATNQYNNVYHFQTNPSGSNNVFTNPLFASSLSITSSDNTTNLYLQATSPSKGTAVSGLTFWNTSTDYNGTAQNSPIDRGAFQFGTATVLASSGQACVANSDCSGGVCSAFACSGSCTANGAACSSNSQCCTNNCSSLTCAVAATCGDGTIQAGEVCDGSNLNGSNCTLQGFTGGSLTCASNCQSFVTSACTNTTVFPLTPILDSATRSNQGPPPSTSWTTLAGTMTISSNKIIGTTNAQASNQIYWNPSVFAADEEVYGTIASKGGTTGDSVNLYLRVDPTTKNGYYVQYNENTAGTDSIILKRWTAGSGTTLVSYSQEVSAGDSIGLSASGSNLTVYYKASAGSWASKGTTVDTTYSVGGVVGAAAGFTTTSPGITNFGGGSLNPITCGNGLKETGEACDGADLASQTCTTQGFASGTLTCATNCQSFVTTSCVTASVCGNNIKEIGELCDGTDLNSQTCSGLGLTTGSLTCASSCLAFVTTGCVSSNPLASGGITLK